MDKRIRISKQNVITFKRIDTKLCTHYEIYASNDSTSEFLLDKIENPKTPSPYTKTKFLDFNKEKTWEFDEKIMAKTSSDVTVYVNDVRLNTGQYTVSSALGLLKIHINIKAIDSIKIEYKVDAIEYIHNTDRKFNYRIVPIFDINYRLGNHSYLKY